MQSLLFLKAILSLIYILIIIVLIPFFRYTREVVIVPADLNTPSTYPYESNYLVHCSSNCFNLTFSIANIIVVVSRLSIVDDTTRLADAQDFWNVDKLEAAEKIMRFEQKISCKLKQKTPKTIQKFFKFVIIVMNKICTTIKYVENSQHIL